MKIRYLGTAAAEGIPGLFCSCELCREAQKLKGKNIRTRSQILINDDVLIDFPPDTYFHKITNGLDLSRIKNVLITHSHSDHCYPLEFTMHGFPYAHGLNSSINVFGNKTVTDMFKEFNRFEMNEEIGKTVILNTMRPYDTILQDDYKITALPAIHTPGEECLIYLIEQNGKSLLHFCDSGALDETVYEKMEKMGVKLSAVSFDCTYGYAQKSHSRHMGVLDNLNEREKMVKHRLTTRETKFVITHFSHNGGLNHAALEEKVKFMNLTVAHDGFELEI